MLFIAVICGIIAGIVFYSSTAGSYKKAGAGQIYRIEASTDVSITRRSDTRAGVRSHVDHGFYSSSVSAAGRAEAYHMPQSIKHTIQQAQKPASAPSNHRPGSASRPPRPSTDRPAGHRGPGGPRGSGRR